ncbi:hypothetical protein WA026_022644 [Henosepilachna vigintioctopunctata]|uniref:Uncharacterized protein n=1 Tax=Henosepilachna vigintioctopunctata TaxID=420089 RepID=A0AAW1UD80_9CUCU
MIIVTSHFDIPFPHIFPTSSVQLWYDYMSKDLLGRLIKEHTPPMPFEINQVYNFFILLLLGLGIGFVVLILEIIAAAIIERYKIMK